VELSVSIAIIAFLLAAALKGQNLVVDAKLQAIISEITSSQVAVNSFYAKYGQYPGDFAASTDNHGVTIKEWGATDAYSRTIAYGDNNSKIEFKNTSGVYEGYILWQHLYLAGMAATPYAGVQTTSAAVPGTDVQISKSGGGYLFDYSNSSSAYNKSTANAYGISGQNIMLLGAPLRTTASPVQVGGILIPTQAMGIDTKMDDGLPTTGNVVAAEGVGATDATCVSGAVYKITATGRNCIMAFGLANN